MADKVTSNFPKVGRSLAAPRNVSAMPTTPTRKRGWAVSSTVVDAFQVKGRRHIKERLGAVGMPQATYAPIEDPAAYANLRNTRLFSAAKSWNDFYNANRGFPGDAPSWFRLS